MAVDWITEGLERTGSMDVVPMLAAMEASRYLRSQAGSSRAGTPERLRAETGADVVVSGSYYRNRDTLSFQCQVTDVRAGKLLAAVGPIVAPAADPIAAITELRTRVMGYLASATDERRTFSGGLGGPAPTYEAYREFSAGILGYMRNDFEDATAHLTQAYRDDSTFATPLLFASISRSNQGRYREADSIAQALVRMRGKLSPFYQDWLDYRLAFLAGDRPKALAAIRRLAARAPHTKATYNLAVEALENGYVDEAIRALESLTHDRGPMRDWIPYWEVLGAAYHLEGRFKAELGAGNEARARYPARLFALLPSLRALAALGRDSELARLFQEAAAMGVDPYGTTLGQLYREAGEEAMAHGRPAAAETYFKQGLTWQRRLPCASGPTTGPISWAPRSRRRPGSPASCATPRWPWEALSAPSKRAVRTICGSTERRNWVSCGRIHDSESSRSRNPNRAIVAEGVEPPRRGSAQ